jgi:hypothetical protein
MCSFDQYISVNKLRDKFKSSKLLPLLIRIYEITNGLKCKSTLQITNEEKAILIDECSQGEFNPSWALMSCFGAMLPNNGETCRAVDKFKHCTGLEIIVIVNAKISLINIQNT